MTPTRSVPRYTSYPTADRFVEAYQSLQHEQALAQRGTAQPLSLYLHIPFCEQLCYYCACNKVITKNRSRSVEYIDHVLREIAMVSAELGSRPGVSQLHWGGGTPTFLDPAEMRQVMAALHRHFDLRPDGEHSIEIDPRRVDDERMALLAELGARLKFASRMNEDDVDP